MTTEQHPAPTTDLTVRDHMTLQLAAKPYRYPAVRATHAREQLGYSETQFWQRVTYLVDQPAAERAHPAIVRRFRRLHNARRRQRSVRRLGEAV